MLTHGAQLPTRVRVESGVAALMDGNLVSHFSREGCESVRSYTCIELKARLEDDKDLSTQALHRASPEL